MACCSPGPFSVSVVLNANTSNPSSTPAVVSASLTDAGSRHKGTAAFADLCNGTLRLMERGRRHGQRGCRDGRAKITATNLIILSRRSFKPEQCINSAWATKFRAGRHTSRARRYKAAHWKPTHLWPHLGNRNDHGKSVTQRLELVWLSPTSVDTAYATRLCGVCAGGIRALRR